MEYLHFISSETYPLIFLPLFIFIARVLDVSIGTIRIIFISKGLKYLAPMVGFFEVMIWLLAVVQLFQNFDNIVYYVAYSGGFAIGTFFGMYIENRLSIGVVIIKLITRRDASDLVDFLKSENYMITSLDAEGMDGEAKLIYMVIQRQDIQDLVKIIKKYNPNAFYTVEDVGFVSKRIFRHKESWYKNHHLDVLRLRRKGK